MQNRYENLEISFVIENTKFNIIQLAYESSVKFHMHAHGYNCYEIHYVYKGKGKVIINDVEYMALPGMLYVTGPEVSHKQTSFINNPISEYCMLLNTEKIASDPGELTQSFLNTIAWFGKDTQLISDTINSLIFEIERDRIGSNVYLSALLQEIIIKCVRNYTVNTDRIRKLKTTSQFDRRDIIIEKAFIYNCATITLQDLAKQLNMSERQIERYLKKIYGKSFSQKKHEGKMSIAKSLLLDSDKLVTTIAQELGYSSSQHFSNAFKRYCGVSPTSYRSSLRL